MELRIKVEVEVKFKEEITLDDMIYKFRSGEYYVSAEDEDGGTPCGIILDGYLEYEDVWWEFESDKTQLYPDESCFEGMKEDGEEFDGIWTLFNTSYWCAEFDNELNINETKIEPPHMGVVTSGIKEIISEKISARFI